MPSDTEKSWLLILDVRDRLAFDEVQILKALLSSLSFPGFFSSHVAFKSPNSYSSSKLSSLWLEIIRNQEWKPGSLAHTRHTGLTPLSLLGTPVLSSALTAALEPFLT